MKLAHRLALVALLALLPALTPGLAAQVLTGTITAPSGTVPFSCGNIENVSAVITGTWTGTLIVETSGDSGVTWVGVDFFVLNTKQFATSITSNASLQFSASGATNCRVKASALASGTVEVAVNRDLTGGPIVVSSANPPESTKPTYIASVGGQATTAAILLSVESSASLGFHLAQVCVGVSDATAAAAVTVTVRRTTTASSGGTALTAEGTGTTAVSKLDPNDANFGGIARLNGTPGTAGATLDQWGFSVGEIGAGASDPPGPSVFCKRYDGGPGKLPGAAAGVTNGISINVSAPGAGGLASGSISATLIAE